MEGGEEEAVPLLPGKSRATGGWTWLAWLRANFSFWLGLLVLLAAIVATGSLLVGISSSLFGIEVPGSDGSVIVVGLWQRCLRPAHPSAVHVVNSGNDGWECDFVNKANADLDRVVEIRRQSVHALRLARFVVLAQFVCAMITLVVTTLLLRAHGLSRRPYLAVAATSTGALALIAAIIVGTVRGQVNHHAHFEWAGMILFAIAAVAVIMALIALFLGRILVYPPIYPLHRVTLGQYLRFAILLHGVLALAAEYGPLGLGMAPGCAVLALLAALVHPRGKTPALIAQIFASGINAVAALIFGPTVISHGSETNRITFALALLNCGLQLGTFVALFFYHPDSSARATAHRTTSARNPISQPQDPSTGAGPRHSPVPPASPNPSTSKGVVRPPRRRRKHVAKAEPTLSNADHASLTQSTAEEDQPAPVVVVPMPLDAAPAETTEITRTPVQQRESNPNASPAQSMRVEQEPVPLKTTAPAPSVAVTPVQPTKPTVPATAVNPSMPLSTPEPAAASTPEIVRPVAIERLDQAPTKMPSQATQPASNSAEVLSSATEGDLFGGAPSIIDFDIEKRGDAPKRTARRARAKVREMEKQEATDDVAPLIDVSMRVPRARHSARLRNRSLSPESERRTTTLRHDQRHEELGEPPRLATQTAKGFGSVDSLQTQSSHAVSSPNSGTAAAVVEPGRVRSRSESRKVLGMDSSASAASMPSYTPTPGLRRSSSLEQVATLFDRSRTSPKLQAELASDSNSTRLVRASSEANVSRATGPVEEEALTVRTRSASLTNHGGPRPRSGSTRSRAGSTRSRSGSTSSLRHTEILPQALGPGFACDRCGRVLADPIVLEIHQRTCRRGQ